MEAGTLYCGNTDGQLLTVDNNIINGQIGNNIVDNFSSSSFTINNGQYYNINNLNDLHTDNLKNTLKELNEDELYFMLKIKKLQNIEEKLITDFNIKMDSIPIDFIERVIKEKAVDIILGENNDSE